MPNFYNLIRATKFSTVSDTAIEIGHTNSATPNFTVDAGGKLVWDVTGPNLYGSTPDRLKTDSIFDAAALVINGTTEIQQSIEKTIDGGELTGTKNIDLLNSAVYRFSSTGNFTLNFRGDSSSTLNSTLDADKCITSVVLVKNTTARSISAIQVDGTTSGVTTRWFGGSTPSGNANATDIYTITILKTASATPNYEVYASQSKFG
jgi:hypothetical protein